ncbi:hypothetical protein AB4Z21_22395 [Paenibacillus sp. MCAF20]
MNVILSAATHRSGSTLVQRILNARPQTLIWGEHLGVLSQFHAIYRKVQTLSEKGKSSRQAYFQSGENPKLLLLVRNPLKAWESYPKSWGEYSGALQFARQWNNNVNDYLAMSRSNPQAVFIQYEKLIAKEADTVGRLTELAQITKEELNGVLAQKIRGSVRKKTITPKQAAVIRRVCRRNMKLLGYL